MQILRKVVFESVDTETGEIETVSEVKRRNKKPRFFLSSLEGSKLLAKMNLGKNEYRVILMLQSKVSYKGLFFVNKTQLSEEFECDRSMLSKTIKTLETHGILLKLGGGYKFSDKYVNCGDHRG